MATDKVAIANLALSKIGSTRITSFTQTGSNEAAIVNGVYDDILEEVLSEHPWSFAQKRTELEYTVPDDVSRTIDDTVYVPVTITNATTADPVVITAASHGLEDGDWIKITGALGMTQLNDNFYIVDNATTNTFSLTDTDGEDVDGSAYTAYISTGKIHKAFDLEVIQNGAAVVYEKPDDYVKITGKSIQRALVLVEQDKIISDVEGLVIKYTFLNENVAHYFPKFIQALATRLAAEICFPIVNSTSKSEALLKYYHDVVLPMAVANDSTQDTPTEAMQDEWLDARIVGTGSGYATFGQTWHHV